MKWRWITSQSRRYATNGFACCSDSTQKVASARIRIRPGERSKSVGSSTKYAGMSIHYITKYWWRREYEKWIQDGSSILHDIQIFSMALRNPRVPFHSRLVAGCAVAYIFSPIQLVPTFIPVIGQLDDLFVLWLGRKLLRKLTPRAVLEECEACVSRKEFKRIPFLRWRVYRLGGLEDILPGISCRPLPPLAQASQLGRNRGYRLRLSKE